MRHKDTNLCGEKDDFYAYLGLESCRSKSYTLDDIKKGYRNASLRHHPDKHSSDTDAVKQQHIEAFRRAQQARDVLSNPGRRRMYHQYFENTREDGPFVGHPIFDDKTEWGEVPTWQGSLPDSDDEAAMNDVVSSDEGGDEEFEDTQTKHSASAAEALEEARTLMTTTGRTVTKNNVQSAYEDYIFQLMAEHNTEKAASAKAHDTEMSRLREQHAEHVTSLQDDLEAKHREELGACKEELGQQLAQSGQQLAQSQAELQDERQAYEKTKADCRQREQEFLTARDSHDKELHEYHQRHQQYETQMNAHLEKQKRIQDELTQMSALKEATTQKLKATHMQLETERRNQVILLEAKTTLEQQRTTLEQQRRDEAAASEKIRTALEDKLRKLKEDTEMREASLRSQHAEQKAALEQGQEKLKQEKEKLSTALAASKEREEAGNASVKQERQQCVSLQTELCKAKEKLQAVDRVMHGDDCSEIDRFEKYEQERSLVLRDSHVMGQMLCAGGVGHAVLCAQGTPDSNPVPDILVVADGQGPVGGVNIPAEATYSHARTAIDRDGVIEGTFVFLQDVRGTLVPLTSKQEANRKMPSSVLENGIIVRPSKPIVPPPPFSTDEEVDRAKETHGFLTARG